MGWSQRRNPTVQKGPHWGEYELEVRGIGFAFVVREDHVPVCEGSENDRWGQLGAKEG